MGLGIPEATILIIVIGIWVFTIAMVAHVFRTARTLPEKIIWTIAMLALPGLSIIYFFTSRQTKHSEPLE